MPSWPRPAKFDIPALMCMHMKQEYEPERGLGHERARMLVRTHRSKLECRGGRGRRDRDLETNDSHRQTPLVSIGRAAVSACAHAPCILAAHMPPQSPSRAFTLWHPPTIPGYHGHRVMPKPEYAASRTVHVCARACYARARACACVDVNVDGCGNGSPSLLAPLLCFSSNCRTVPSRTCCVREHTCVCGMKDVVPGP